MRVGVGVCRGSGVVRGSMAWGVQMWWSLGFRVYGVGVSRCHSIDRLPKLWLLH